jgi:hypothetical protein
LIFNFVYVCIFVHRKNLKGNDYVLTFYMKEINPHNEIKGSNPSICTCLNYVSEEMMGAKIANRELKCKKFQR